MMKAVKINKDIVIVKNNKETIHSSCKEPLPAPDLDQYGKT